MMNTLESDRLILRNWAISDLDDLHVFASNKKVADLAGFKIKPNKEANKVIGWIELLNATFVPSQGIFNYPKEIGFTLAEEYWGQGLMPEIIQQFANYLFNEEEIDAVVCSHFINNIQSEKAMKKCGFEFYLEDEEEKYYYLTKNALDLILRTIDLKILVFVFNYFLK